MIHHQDALVRSEIEVPPDTVLVPDQPDLKNVAAVGAVLLLHLVGALDATKIDPIVLVEVRIVDETVFLEGFSMPGGTCPSLNQSRCSGISHFEAEQQSFWPVWVRFEGSVCDCSRY